MRTFSHLLLTAVGQQQLKARGIRIHTAAVLLGSVLPDLPLMLLMGGYSIYYSWIAPIPQEEVMRLVHEELYFTNPIWIVGHNLFHSPVLVGFMLILGYVALRIQRTWAAFLFWFALGAGFHSLIDIFTHHTDGPLLLFPFNWELRFHSPISYWDPRYYGRTVTLLEYLIDGALLLYFAIRWMRHRSAKHKPYFLHQQDQNHHEQPEKPLGPRSVRRPPAPESERYHR